MVTKQIRDCNLKRQMSNDGSCVGWRLKKNSETRDCSLRFFLTDFFPLVFAFPSGTIKSIIYIVLHFGAIQNCRRGVGGFMDLNVHLHSTRTTFVFISLCTRIMTLFKILRRHREIKISQRKTRRIFDLFFPSPFRTCECSRADAICMWSERALGIFISRNGVVYVAFFFALRSHHPPGKKHRTHVFNTTGFSSAFCQRHHLTFPS